MQVLIVIIEKIGKNYVGRSPNLLGVSVKGKTRDEAESKILEEIENRLNKLRELHSPRKAITIRGQLEEVIECVYQYRGSLWTDYQCVKPSQKEGLCWQHWKKLYSHAVGTKINLDGCPLCGELNQDVLRRWDVPCSFKAENTNWEEILEEKRKNKQEVQSKQDREERLKSHEKYLRCTATLTNRKQCSSLANKGKYCEYHFTLNLKTPRYRENDRSETQQESSRNYFKSRFRKK